MQTLDFDVQILYKASKQTQRNTLDLLDIRQNITTQYNLEITPKI